jgi:3-hydroxyisobutyrate dehydrogenase-like beta-hydroxyacid dehydrogenase
LKIAVLGMGRMGQAVAGRLLECGHDVVIWNRSAGKATALMDNGAKVSTSAADAVSAVEVAITSLANDDAVRSVAFDPLGIQDGLPGDGVYVDSSTVSPRLSTELDGAFRRFVAMPILGSPAATAAGQATYLVGGRGSAVQAVDALFPGLSASVVRYATPALASTAKLTVNLLLLDAVAALAEAFAVGRAGGLTDEQLRDLLLDSPILTPGIRNRFEGVLSGRQEPWWTAGMGAKDARLAIETAAAGGSDLKITSAAHDLYQRVASMAATDDIAAVGRIFGR